MKKRLRKDTEGVFFHVMRVNPTVIFVVLIALLVGCAGEPKVLHTFRFISDGQSTVLQQLQELHRVTADSSSMGVLVKSIDEIDQTRTAFWLYFVNSEAASAAADSFIPESGDTIEWRLTELY